MTPTGDDDWWARPRTQLLLLVATVVVLVLTTAVIATQGEPEQNTLEYDARTYAIQFLLLTGLGAVVAFLVDLEKRTCETRQQRRKFETETVSDALEQLDRIYAEVKNVRRMLRVDAALGELDARRLREHMSSLNQDQTSVEQLRKRLEALDSKVPGLAVIVVHLEGFDKYLSRYWDAFEKYPCRVRG